MKIKLSSMQKKVSHLISTLLLLGAISSCGLLSKTGDDDPARLVKFDQEISLERVWSVNVGKGQGDRYNRLKPALSGGTIYVASNDGLVMAIDTESGRRLWRSKLDYDITGGVGVGPGLVLVGSENSQVVALDSENGDIKWEASVSSEILSSPATDGNIVVVQSVDGKLTGLNAETGEQEWIYESTVPDLSLRGTSSPVIQRGYVLAAFANGSIVSIAIDNGTLRWEERVAIPTGRSEIERLVDIDGSLHLGENGQLMVPSYQGYLAVVDVTTGQTRWRIQESSTVGLSSGFGNVYISDEESYVKAYRTGQDEIVWQNEQLKLRKVSAPFSFNNYVVVADYKGYIHLLSQIDGHFMSRIRIDRKGVRAGMLSQNNMLYVYGNSGNLVALKIQ